MYNLRLDRKNMISHAELAMNHPERLKEMEAYSRELRKTVNAYEYIRFLKSYETPGNVKEFILEFPESEFINNIFSKLYSLLKNRRTREEAIEVFEWLRSRYPDNYRLVNTFIRYARSSGGDTEKAIKLVDEFLASDKNEDLRRIAYNYHFLLTMSDYDDKMDEFSEAYLKVNPNDEKEFLRQVGTLYNQNKKYDRAFEYLNRVLDKYPDHWDSMYFFAENAADSGKFLDKGLKYMLNFRENGERSGWVRDENIHLILGMLYEKKGDSITALEEYNRALKINPDFREAKKGLERIKK